MGCRNNLESNEDGGNSQADVNSLCVTEPEQNKTVSGNQGNARPKCRNGNSRKRGTILKDEEVECSGCSR